MKRREELSSMNIDSDTRNDDWVAAAYYDDEVMQNSFVNSPNPHSLR